MNTVSALSNVYSQQECYFDMGGFGSHIWEFIKWENPHGETFQITQFDAYLGSLFAEMKEAGMDQLELSFAQLCDIDALVSGDFSKVSGNDVIAQLLQQMVSSNVYFPPGTNLLSLITAKANEMGMKVALSMGGANASSQDFQICKVGQTPEQQAAKLAAVMNKYGIASVDFDVEGGNMSALGQQPGAAAFFSALQLRLQPQQKTATLTIQGSLTATVWGNGNPNDPATFNGPLKSLFYNQNNERIFNTLFSGVNLMMYDSGTHYYLDAKVYPNDTINPSWCIESWLDVVGKNNAGMIHVGFQDATPYQLQSASASGHTYYVDPYNPRLAVDESDSPGTAAAKILLQIQNTLVRDGYTTPLGAPFWWPNYSGKRYAPVDYSKNNFQAQFVSQPMNDFFHTLQSLGTINKTETSARRGLSSFIAAFMYFMTEKAQSIIDQFHNGGILIGAFNQDFLASCRKKAQLAAARVTDKIDQFHNRAILIGGFKTAQSIIDQLHNRAMRFFGNLSLLFTSTEAPKHRYT